MSTARSARALTRAVAPVFAFIFICLVISRPPSFSRTDSEAFDITTSLPTGDEGPKCSPRQWADGTWAPRANPKQVLIPNDVYDASGFLGCASNREVGLHLSNNKPEKLPWRGNISAYEWTPKDRACGDVPRDYRETLLTHLVEKGGWLLVGDSVTQEHFFSLSCILYPHVRATPDQSRGYDHSWRQDLFLASDSPLIPSIKIPEGFDFEATPLVTFRRNDLLFNLTEVEALFNGGGWRPAPGEASRLFGKERTWTISPSEYLAIFLSPPPIGNYQTLIVSTGGHWSLKLFAGLKKGFPEIHDLFRVVQNNFVYQVGRALDTSKDKMREVIIRPYLPGDDKCHSDRIMNGGPSEEPPDLKGASYNWEWIPRLNLAFEEAVSTRGHPNIHYLPIDRPGRLRPDTHLLTDCLHLTVGTGVIEGWTQYIHYYISSYLPWQRESEELMGLLEQS